MVDVEVVSAISFRKILVRAPKVPLTASNPRVVSRRRNREHTPHGQDPAANVLPMEVAAEADLLQLDFIRPEYLGRSAKRVILRMVEAAHKVRVKSDFRSEEFRIPHRVLVACSAI